MSAPQSEWDTSYEWKAVTLLTLGFGLVGLDRWIIAPLFPSMMKDLGLDYQALGNLIGALGLAWGVFAIVAGGLSDRLGRVTSLTESSAESSRSSDRRGLRVRGNPWRCQLEPGFLRGRIVRSCDRRNGRGRE